MNINHVIKKNMQPPLTLGGPSNRTTPIKTTTIMLFLMMAPMYITSVAFFIMGILIIFINGFGQSRMMLLIVWMIVILWAMVVKRVLRAIIFQNDDHESGYNYAFTLITQLMTNLGIFIAVAMTVSEMGRNLEVHPIDTTMVLIINLLGLMTYGLALIIDAHAVEKLYINLDYYLSMPMNVLE